jgi:hypothetical protein
MEISGSHYRQVYEMFLEQTHTLCGAHPFSNSLRLGACYGGGVSFCRCLTLVTSLAQCLQISGFSPPLPFYNLYRRRGKIYICEESNCYLF